MALTWPTLSLGGDLAWGTQWEVWHEAEFAKELERMLRAHCEAEDKAAAANK